MNIKTGLGLFAVGIGVGAAFGILYAPQNGKATRKRLSRKAEDGVDFVSERTREIRKQAEDVLEKGREFASRLVA